MEKQNIRLDNVVLITGSQVILEKFNWFLERNKVDYIGIDLTKPYTNKCIKMSILDTKIGTKIKKLPQ